MKSYPFAVLLLSLIGCQPHPFQPETDCQAIFVCTEQIGCRLPIVIITKGLEQARQLVQASTTYEGYFSVYGLDSTYWQANRQLEIRIRRPTQYVVCDMLGITHPVIEVVAVH